MLKAILRTTLMIVIPLALFGCNHDAEARADDDEPKAESAGAEESGEEGASTGAAVEGNAQSKAESAMRPDNVPEGAAEAVFAGGCFWCVEAVFEELDGVYEAVSGYAGGTAENANYRKVASGMSKHAEVVKIYFDPDKITYQTLLEVHFVTHDPTTLNRQGNDVGPQYRSAIFYADDEEKAAAKAYIEELDSSGQLDDPVVTTLEPLNAFYVAEDYHQDYVCENPMQGYVQGVALPKVKKVREKFEKKLKEKSKIPVAL